MKIMSEMEFNTEATRSFQMSGGKILLFHIDNNVYGIEIEYITEIIGIQPITIVPKVPDYIKGVINLRGKVIPVMNVRRRFGKPEIPYDERTCIIVVEWDTIAVGLIVDRVDEVLEVDPKQIASTPDYKSVNANRYIRSIIQLSDGVKLLLDCQKIVTDKLDKVIS